ncbi:hypothetical protein GJ496_002969 [Pomphorhynchus laevis]|nr:hypothetical protein GJ496_002969 [Pomphorhynchus laevis]
MKRDISEISYTTVEINESELQILRDHFSVCDTNQDGFITIDELKELMRTLRQEETEERLNAIVKSIDLNRDGRVSFEEFKILFKRLKKLSIIKLGSSSDVNIDAHNAFKVFDRDDDGYITLPEIKLVMSYLGENVDEEKAMQMLKMADANNDGKISEEEFIGVFKSLMLTKCTTHDVEGGINHSAAPRACDN